VNRRHIRRQLEQAEAPVVLVLGLCAILAIVAWFLFDMGRLGLGLVRGRNAVELASFEAANDVDASRFVHSQAVVLAPDAASHFRSAVERYRMGEGMSVQVDSTELLAGGAYLRVRGHIRIPVGLSWIWGSSEIKIPFQSVIEPRYGIEGVFD
jgi:hypothetical protein